MIWSAASSRRETRIAGGDGEKRLTGPRNNRRYALEQDGTPDLVAGGSGSAPGVDFAAALERRKERAKLARVGGEYQGAALAQPSQLGGASLERDQAVRIEYDSRRRLDQRGDQFAPPGSAPQARPDRNRVSSANQLQQRVGGWLLQLLGERLKIRLGLYQRHNGSCRRDGVDQSGAGAKGGPPGEPNGAGHPRRAAHHDHPPPDALVIGGAEARKPFRS